MDKLIVTAFDETTDKQVVMDPPQLRVQQIL